MVESAKVFTRSIPQIYDIYLVPLICEAYGDDIAERAGALGPRIVLETAAGTGIVTQTLTLRVADAARFVVADLDHSMLNHA